MTTTDTLATKSQKRDYEFDVEDVEYLRHGDKPLLVRLYKPRGPGPFPAMVELHGGAWAQYDRLRGKGLHESLAKSGITVAALDFRQGPDGAYPRSVADINYGVRWVKAHAAELKTRPDMVGISGNSSGGHLAMLVAMRPRDPRYAAFALPPDLPAVDATLRCVVMFWPVINPSGRYRNARKLRDSANPPEWPAKNMAHSISYWQNEENMVEGNPMLALERGEKVELPPAIWIQSSNDEVHDYHDGESDFPGTEAHRFADRYRKAGGELVLEYFDAPALFTTVHPLMPQSVEAMSHVIAFVHRHIPG